MQLILSIVKIVVLMWTFSVMATATVVKTTRDFLLGETAVKINIYEKEGSKVTFVAPHFNEQIANKLARKYIEKYGGRLVEIESFDDKGNPSRYIKFRFNNKIYSIDPNRIFTDNGRRCGGSNSEIEPLIKRFADNFLRTVLSEDSKTLREDERFIVAVHNNNDVDTKKTSAKFGDLTASSFTKFRKTSHGFQEQADGVYLSNSEEDIDNFIFVSTPKYISYFAEKGFNVVVQKNSAKLFSEKCNIDDGSLSVFSAQNNIQYICLEADGITGLYRQQEMFEAIYELLSTETKSDKSIALNK